MLQSVCQVVLNRYEQTSTIDLFFYFFFYNCAVRHRTAFIGIDCSLATAHSDAPCVLWEKVIKAINPVLAHSLFPLPPSHSRLCQGSYAG